MMKNILSKFYNIKNMKMIDDLGPVHFDAIFNHTIFLQSCIHIYICVCVCVCF